MIASSHPLAVDAGLEILRAGGNAIDAGIAIQFALAVVNPRAGNIGGGGFMVVRQADGQVTTLDYREKAPAASHRDMYLNEAGEVDTVKSRFGHQAVGVPGTVAGLVEAHQKHGKLPFARLLDKAIEYAEAGFLITQVEAERLNKYQDSFQEFNTVFNVFIRRNTWKAGDLLRQPDLAKTLRRIQEKGRPEFYQGETAQLILAEMKRGKGLITASDLQDYAPAWRSPIRMQYEDYTIYSMPPPSSGGIALAQMLEMLEPFGLEDMHVLTPESVHLIAESMRRAFSDRAKYLGDMDYYPVPVQEMLDSIYLAEKMSDFEPDTVTGSRQVEAGDWSVPMETFETTHTSVVDQQGMAVSITTTLNSNYGSKVLVGNAGFFLNNEMDDFSAKPMTPNQFGLVGSEANAIAPGKRMLSSMTPTIIEQHGEFYMALGAPGGPTIITSVFQVFLNTAVFDLPLDEAISTPRFHHQWLPDALWVERDLFPDSLRVPLNKLGYRFTEKKSLGRIKAVMQLPDGTLMGGGDPRNPDDHAAGY